MSINPNIQPVLPPNPNQTYICTTIITDAKDRLKTLVLALSKEELFGLRGCCEKWDEAFKVFAALNTYNRYLLNWDAQSNNVKKCICNYLNR